MRRLKGWIRDRAALSILIWLLCFGVAGIEVVFQGIVNQAGILDPSFSKHIFVTNLSGKYFSKLTCFHLRNKFFIYGRKLLRPSTVPLIILCERWPRLRGIRYGIYENRRRIRGAV